MAITGINIVENNIIDNIALLSINNPLVFVVRATYSGGIPPDLIYASIENSPDVDYKCVYLRDESATERDFYFIADEILRRELGIVEDFNQSSDTILNTVNLDKEITIWFTDDGNEGEPYEDTITCTFANVARDFENINGACLIDLYNNDSKYYVGAVGKQMYLYWYNDDADNVIDGILAIQIGATPLESGENARDYFADNYADISTIDNEQNLYIHTVDFGGNYRIEIEASNGATITFSAISLPSGWLDTIVNNGTTSAELYINYSTQPTNGESINFTYNDGSGDVAVTGTYDTSSGFKLDKGFIRKAIIPTSIGETSESITINQVEYSHTVNVREYCNNDVIIKYLDRNGQYRFMPFTRYYTRSVNPELIGSVNELILSLANDSGDTRNIGYKNKDRLTLKAEKLKNNELLLMKDLYTSPEIYVLLDKWVRITVNGENLVKQAKGNFKDITITAELPQSYNITEL